MKALHAYLTFDGNTREAMAFYAKCLGGEMQAMPFSEMPGGAPPEAKDRVMHAHVVSGSIMLMASDTMPGHPFVAGNSFSLSLNCDDNAEQDRVFAALSEGGQVTMPLQDVFWGSRFGMLKDKFGVQWMLSVEKKGAQG